MKDCCKETYKNTIKEVLNFILKMPGKSMFQLVKTLQYIIKMLEKPKDSKEEIKIYFNEWVDK